MPPSHVERARLRRAPPSNEWRGRLPAPGNPSPSEETRGASAHHPGSTGVSPSRRCVWVYGLLVHWCVGRRAQGAMERDSVEPGGGRQWSPGCPFEENAPPPTALRGADTYQVEGAASAPRVSLPMTMRMPVQAACTAVRNKAKTGLTLAQGFFIQYSEFKIRYSIFKRRQVPVPKASCWVSSFAILSAVCDSGRASRNILWSSPLLKKKYTSTDTQLSR